MKQRFDMMLMQLLSERGVGVQDLHDMLREAGHNYTLEHLCCTILGVRGRTGDDVVKHIIDLLGLSDEEALPLCGAYGKRERAIRCASW